MNTQKTQETNHASACPPLSVGLAADELITLLRVTTTYFSEYTNSKGELKTITHYVSQETRNAMADFMAKHKAEK